MIDGFENAGGPQAMFRQRRYEAASSTVEHGLHMYRPKKKQLKQSGSRKTVGTLQAGSKAQHLVLSQNVQNIYELNGGTLGKSKSAKRLNKNDSYISGLNLDHTNFI